MIALALPKRVALCSGIVKQLECGCLSGPTAFAHRLQAVARAIRHHRVNDPDSELRPGGAEGQRIAFPAAMIRIADRSWWQPLRRATQSPKPAQQPTLQLC